MKLSFENKVALVTGAGSGMGLATAQASAAEGAAVVLGDVNEAAVHEAAEQLGIWSCMKYEFLQMREQGEGAIVNCSSLGGLGAWPVGQCITPPSMACSD